MSDPKQDESLISYLNDHLAGSVTAVELINHLIQNARDSYLFFLTGLLSDVEKDQEVLTKIIELIGGKPSRIKTSSSWLMEKLGRLKFTHERGESYDLSDVEELESLVLGIHGKEALWILFREVFPDDSRFAGIDFQHLIDCAQQQHEAVERYRLEAGRATFLGQ